MVRKSRKTEGQPPRRRNTLRAAATLGWIVMFLAVSAFVVWAELQVLARKDRVIPSESPCPRPTVCIV